MNLYTKILTTRYYYLEHIKLVPPSWLALCHTSFLHTVNIFLIVLHFDFKVNFLGDQIFDVGVILLAILLAGLHYVLIVKRKAFTERVKEISINSFKLYDGIHLVYELFTIGFYFYVYQMSPINFFYIVIALVALFLYRHFLTEK